MLEVFLKGGSSCALLDLGDPKWKWVVVGWTIETLWLKRGEGEILIFT